MDLYEHLKMLVIQQLSGLKRFNESTVRNAIAYVRHKHGIAGPSDDRLVEEIMIDFENIRKMYWS